MRLLCACVPVCWQSVLSSTLSVCCQGFEAGRRRGFDTHTCQAAVRAQVQPKGLFMVPAKLFGSLSVCRHVILNS